MRVELLPLGLMIKHPESQGPRRSLGPLAASSSFTVGRAYSIVRMYLSTKVMFHAGVSPLFYLSLLLTR